MLKNIKRASEKINNGRKIEHIFLGLAEEVGELGQEIRVQCDPTCYKEPDVDGIIGECSDVIIQVVDIALNAGYTIGDIEKSVAKKLKKWMSKTGSYEKEIFLKHHNKKIMIYDRNKLYVDLITNKEGIFIRIASNIDETMLSLDSVLEFSVITHILDGLGIKFDTADIDNL